MDRASLVGGRAHERQAVLRLNGVPRRKRIPDQISTSKNRAHHTTVGAQGCAVRSRRERAGGKRNECRDFIRSSETPQERSGPCCREKFFFHGGSRHVFGFGQIVDEFFHAF